MLHVHAPSPRARDRVAHAIVGAMTTAGYTEVRADADCTIRLGGRMPWLSISADAPVLEALAAGIARATKAPVLEAYCEASAIVWLALRSAGRRYGWSVGRRPPARVIEPLLARGDARALGEAWDRGLAEPFPEAALAFAARQLGIPPKIMVGDVAPRGRVLRFARPAAPATRTRGKKLRVGWPSNRAWGERHLVFEGDKFSLDVEVTGTGDRLAAEVTATPPLIAVLEVRPEPAQHMVAVQLRAEHEGACTLQLRATTATARGSDELAVQIMPRPYRPRAAVDRDPYALFQMHRREHVYGFVTFRVPLRDAWVWARPHAIAWAQRHGDRPPAEAMTGELPAARTLVIESPSFRFGTMVPIRDRDEPLAVELVLRARARADDATPQLDQLATICDAALRDGVAWSAIVGEQGDLPGEVTGWELVTLTHRDPARFASWHATHVRGLDARIWMSGEHAARIDRAAVARHATVEAVGSGYRISMPPGATRSAFAPIEQLLAHLLPHST